MKYAPASPSGIGVKLYGAGAVLLGCVGLATRDFAVDWQHVGPNVALRAPLAVLAAVLELLAGLALFSRRTARFGAIGLTVLFAIFVSLWIPRIIEAVTNGDGWGNFFEELLALVAAVIVLIHSRPSELSTRRAAAVARIVGVCALWFGTEHLLVLKPAATLVPGWLPFPGVFWVAATAICFFGAGISILTGILDTVSSLLLGLMLLGFQLLCWLPKLFAPSAPHFIWSANGVALAFAGAAWVAADAIRARKCLV